MYTVCCTGGGMGWFPARRRGPSPVAVGLTCENSASAPLQGRRSPRQGEEGPGRGSYRGGSVCQEVRHGDRGAMTAKIVPSCSPGRYPASTSPCSRSACPAGCVVYPVERDLVHSPRAVPSLLRYGPRGRRQRGGWAKNKGKAKSSSAAKETSVASAGSSSKKLFMFVAGAVR